MYALIDGDIIVYRCGFAAQRNEYVTSDGQVYRYKRELSKAIKESGDYEVNTIIEPLENALNNAKTVLVAVLEATDAEDYSLWLSGDTNFRNDIATIREYKGNRDPLHKPVWYEQIKDYLVNTWQAAYTENVEADDVLADWMINSPNNENSCIVSTDKDLDQVPGWHYNWVKEEKYYISPEKAEENLYIQLLMGDSTDNIEGIPGVGPKTARRWILNRQDDESPYDVVKSRYRAFFELSEEGKNLCNKYQMTWDEILEETEQLIRLGEYNNNNNKNEKD